MTENKTKKKTTKKKSAPKEDTLDKTREVETVTASTTNKSANSHKEVRQVKVKKKKNKGLGFNWFFWTCLVIFMIPTVYFISLLVAAQQETNVPIIGDRITNSVESVIPEEKVGVIKERISGLSDVEKCEVNLIVETLRVTCDVRDDMTSEQIEALNTQIYEIVNNELPVATYFTQHYDYKQYDLEIFSYTNLDASTPIIVVTNKNSLMEAPVTQVLTNSLNPELAEELRNSSEEDLNKDKNDGDIKDDTTPDVTDEDLDDTDL